MSESVKCPKCASADTLFVKELGKHLCKQCEQVFPAAPAVMPLRIFLSYGHDANEELVRSIKSDFEQRGHDVWFDKSEIKAGDDWRRSITEGITKSHKFVSFLSKHSTLDPGVCRDEIVIALTVKGGNIQTILVESEQEVQPPVNIGHIQWLDMHDWKEQHAAGKATWEQWYQAKFAEIVRVVESDESRRFAGEIETLNGHLKPIRSEARICQLLGKGFCGRQWLFEAVEKWRQDPKLDSRLFWIMGAPGVGKSAFAAQLTHTRGDTVIAAQFCEWDKPDHRHPPRVVRSLAFQLATRLPDYRKLLLTLPEIAELDTKDAAELFDYLLSNPLNSIIRGGRERYLIVIDALDEAGEAGRNPLVEMLARNAQRLPDWLGLVVTSRPEFDVKTPMQALNPFPLDTQSESNRADLRDYLRRELAPHLQNRPDADRLVEQILKKSEGVFLYVERICEDVQSGHLSLERPEQFPQGLGGIFLQYFQRQFPDGETYEKTIEPALGAILAARESLPVELLQHLFGWRETELRKWLRTLGSLFTVTTEAGHEFIKPYHKSLADWLVDESAAGPYFVSESEGHRSLAECAWRQIASGRNTHKYFTTSLAFHLRCSEQWERILALALISFQRSLNNAASDFDQDAVRHTIECVPTLGMASDACVELALPDGKVVHWNPNGCRVVQTLTEVTDNPIWAGFSPDGSRLSVICRRSIWVCKVGDGNAFEKLESLGPFDASESYFDRMEYDYAGVSGDGEDVYVLGRWGDERWTLFSWQLRSDRLFVLNESYDLEQIQALLVMAPSVCAEYGLNDCGVWAAFVTLKPSQSDGSKEAEHRFILRVSSQIPPGMQYSYLQLTTTRDVQDDS